LSSILIVQFHSKSKSFFRRFDSTGEENSTAQTIGRGGMINLSFAVK
jgi:hypothetical protein